MPTKLSVFLGEDPLAFRGMDTLILPMDTRLNLRATSLGRRINTEDGGVLGKRLREIRRCFTLATGLVDMPSEFCFYTPPGYLPFRCVLAPVLGSLGSSMIRGQLSGQFQRTYRNSLEMGSRMGFRTAGIFLSALELSDSQYTTLLLEFLTGVRTSIHAGYWSEVCLLPASSFERGILLDLLENYSLALGYPEWWSRTSPALAISPKLSYLGGETLGKNSLWEEGFR